MPLPRTHRVAFNSSRMSPLWLLLLPFAACSDPEVGVAEERIFPADGTVYRFHADLNQSFSEQHGDAVFYGACSDDGSGGWLQMASQATTGQYMVFDVLASLTVSTNFERSTYSTSWTGGELHAFTGTWNTYQVKPPEGATVEGFDAVVTITKQVDPPKPKGYVWVNIKCQCSGVNQDQPPNGVDVDYPLDVHDCVFEDTANNPSFLMGYAQTNCPGYCVTQLFLRDTQRSYAESSSATGSSCKLGDPVGRGNK